MNEACCCVARLPGTQVFIGHIGMPGMDGYEMTRQLRANSATQHAMRVALTGYDLLCATPLSLALSMVKAELGPKMK